MHIALRSMQVQGLDGVSRQVRPGDNVPEAEGWKTKQAYINRGWICVEGGALNDAASARLASALRDKDKEIDRLKAELADSDVETSAVEATNDLEPAVEADQDEEPKLTRQDLQKMSKESLMTLADSMGVDPGQSKNKLVEAIFAAQ